MLSQSSEKEKHVCIGDISRSRLKKEERRPVSGPNHRYRQGHGWPGTYPGLIFHIVQFRPS